MAKYEGRLFINGELVPAVAGETFPLKNPATDEYIADVSIARLEDVDKAVAAAEKAQPAWANTPAHIRARIFRKFADLIHENSTKLQELDSVAMGKPLTAAKSDVEDARNISNYFCGLMELAGGQASTNSADHLNLMIRQPFGVVAAIIPWNFPLNIFCHEIVPACGAGNAMILKSSEKAPLSAPFLAQLALQAGVPPGIVQVISGAGETGALLSSHMKIRKISFTGSTNTGRRVMEAAAKSNLKDVALELGGKSPLVVFADADLAHAAQMLIKSFTFNSGQVCTASTRAYIEKSAAAEFKTLLVDGVTNLKQGPPMQYDIDLGPQADSVQADKISQFLDIGENDGKILVGGKRATDVGTNFIQPTIFTDIQVKSDINMLEVFGPVLVLHEFENEEEVIKRANDTEYGLYASVFSKDIRKALRVARALEAGSVAVNVASPYGAYELPFGGFKGSGIGRQKGSNAVDAWLQEKAIFIQHNW
ncbi:aldehyde dehydrogenase domain-containing protein [Trichoderma sp. SZMC 28014]